MHSSVAMISRRATHSAAAPRPVGVALNVERAPSLRRHCLHGAPLAAPSTETQLVERSVQQASRSIAVGSAPSVSTVVTEVPTTTGKDIVELEYELDSRGLKRVKYAPGGWNFWNWRGHRIHYAQAGNKDGPPVVLVHGYGASAYHWRYNIPALVDAGYHVFAVDLLGFGLSEKALVDYTNGKQWIPEIGDFVRDVVGGGPAVLVGNSLGGYASLATAATYPDLIRGVALLNGAGPFDDPAGPPRVQEVEQWYTPAVQAVTNAVKRVVLFFGFIQAKQPEQIRKVLELVYVNKDVIDADLVQSIIIPAEDPQASEVFFRVNNNSSAPVTVNTLLSKLKAPLLLLWGDKDPWIVPSRAQKIKDMHPQAELRFISSGHCPHDDSSEDANSELLAWLGGIDEVTTA